MIWERLRQRWPVGRGGGSKAEPGPHKPERLRAAVEAVSRGVSPDRFGENGRLESGEAGREALVLEVMRMSTEDGPGLRTTVFMKGCSLRCTWCHNPESIPMRPQTQWVGSRCLGCGLCVPSCTQHALSRDEAGAQLDRARCRGCGQCAQACPATALEVLGKRWTLGGLVEEVLKDRAYFEPSGGGVTVSGGEPGLQAGFVARFLAALKGHGVRTALDTCGQCAPEGLEAMLPHADLVLYDLKEIDPARHKAVTGVGPDRILENAVRVARQRKAAGGELWIRTPIIPGATDRAENLRGIGHFIATELQGTVTRWELCAFNNLCRDKYARLGLDWPFADTPLCTRESLEALAEVARASGVDPAVVTWSGTTRMA